MRCFIPFKYFKGKHDLEDCWSCASQFMLKNILWPKKIYVYICINAYNFHDMWKRGLRENMNVKTIYPLEKKRKIFYIICWVKTTSFHFGNRGKMFHLICWAIVVWIYLGSYLSLYFYIIEAPLSGLETTVNSVKWEVFCRDFRARRWIPESLKHWASFYLQAPKQVVRSRWGCSRWNVPQVMLIREAQGLGRSAVYCWWWSAKG